MRCNDINPVPAIAEPFRQNDRVVKLYSGRAAFLPFYLRRLLHLIRHEVECHLLRQGLPCRQADQRAIGGQVPKIGPFKQRSALVVDLDDHEGGTALFPALNCLWRRRGIMAGEEPHGPAFCLKGVVCDKRASVRGSLRFRSLTVLLNLGRAEPSQTMTVDGLLPVKQLVGRQPIS